MAPSAQALQPLIFDAGASKRLGHRFLVELRPPARAGERADVGESRDPMLAEQFKEAFDRMSRMADAEEQHAVRLESRFRSAWHRRVSNGSSRADRLARAGRESAERRQRETARN